MPHLMPCTPQAIDPMGREIALRRGSNILMPILTPTKYREHYQLYEGKPCITDSADECRKCLNARISMIGEGGALLLGLLALELTEPAACAAGAGGACV